jgi:predicted nucleotidyltransferase
MDWGHVLATFRAHESDLKEAGVSELSPFGSAARRDARPDSEVA